MFNTSHINIAIDQATSDAGATGHFVLPGNPVKNTKPSTNQLTINLLDGYQINSTHTCQLDIPCLPAAEKEAHIVLGLALNFFVSIKVLCNTGYNVEYDTNKCRVIYKDKTVWNDNRETYTELWVLPLNPTPNFKISMDHVQSNPMKEVATNAYTITSKRFLIKYLHQCLFCPLQKTLLKAIVNDQFPTWPGLTYTTVKKYPPNAAPATYKGHMKRKRQGTQSTKEQVKTDLDQIKYKRDMIYPIVKEKRNQLFLV